MIFEFLIWNPNAAGRSSIPDASFYRSIFLLFHLNFVKLSLWFILSLMVVWPFSFLQLNLNGKFQLTSSVTEKNMDVPPFLTCRVFKTCRQIAHVIRYQTQRANYIHSHFFCCTNSVSNMNFEVQDDWMKLEMIVPDYQCKT